jgi:hypothetical protein
VSETYATFRFVPVAPGLVVEPPVRREVLSFERPLAEGSVSGTLTVTWTARTPICVGAAADEGRAVEPLQIGGRYALPGTTQRGMIRAVLEAATFSHLGRINDARHHGVRDFVGHGDHHAIARDDVRAGWLRYDATRDTWLFLRGRHTESRFVRVPFESVLQEVALGGSGAPGRKIDSAHWQVSMDVEDKLRALPPHLRLRKIQALYGPAGSRPSAKSGIPRAYLRKDPTVPVSFQSATHPGKDLVLVVTGPYQQDAREGSSRREDRKAGVLKTHEALFPLPVDADQAIVIPNAWMSVFHRQHGDVSRTGANPRGAWRFWLRAFGWEDALSGFEADADDQPLDRLLDDPAKLPGIPVFWHWHGDLKNRNPAIDFSAPPGRQAFWFGLSRVIRVPYAYSVGEVAQRLYGEPGKPYRVPRLDEPLGWDFARALFGEVDRANTRVAEQEHADGSKHEQALRGRVAFDVAWAPEKTRPEGVIRRGVFAQPRESFWPFYLARSEDAEPDGTPVDYSHPDAVPAGRKRTVARRTAVPDTQWPQGNGNEDTVTGVRFLPAGTVFQSRVRVHNLHPVEFGALLWALTFGDGEGGHWHQAGRAKGFGYGALSPCVTIPKGLRVINMAQPPSDPTTLRPWLSLFERYMTECLQGDYGKREEIRTLRACANPATGQNAAAQLTVSSLEAYRQHREEAKKGRLSRGARRNRLPDLL